VHGALVILPLYATYIDLSACPAPRARIPKEFTPYEALVNATLLSHHEPVPLAEIGDIDAELPTAIKGLYEDSTTHDVKK
jgi:hypothetical protein